VWFLWVVSLGVLAARFQVDGTWELSGLFSVDGLTVVMWVAVTFFSGIIHSFSQRYLAGSKHRTRFFTRVFAFTAAVMVLVAADNILLFASAWLAMGLLMAQLIGLVEGWPQAQAAAAVARRYFLASSALLAASLVTLSWYTGTMAISEIISAVGTIPSTVALLAAGGLLLAAMVQSALVPFHTWLLSSMTAPTPASALMHAGFVNAGGILLTRFAPVVSIDATFMLLIVVVGAVSALLGKLLKSVQSDVKRQLGCSTTGQMGFMIMQAGLGFFGAAVTHLILHGFYKAYLFLSTGDQVEHTSPDKTHPKTESTGIVGITVTILSAVTGGVLFAFLTGKGTSLDSGLLLTGLVAITTLHATRTAVRQTALPAAVRYGAVPLVFLPAIAVYAGAYTAIEGLLKGVPLATSAVELTFVHGIVAAGFLVAYVAIETGVYKQSKRLYVRLLNATQPPSDTVLTSTEDYNEY
jgi:NAD(P)H-quinone oxidoreductase subunit 5